ncbi:Formiminotransferase-cyclodeaminase [Proteiniphilum saccharofermentans]|jgi:formiminotetrahydrofolate cyclodeaminase|uniref:Formiminotransferase-cyclodeaminase n=1 Tax=Proteiniphilum saccharofermentans TaxID=1642647 RepID=A0A1R3T300_9BACT|nr:MULTISPECIES: cyclodeaminase/cyclohydrolase family protein [Proteiniphilum]MDY9919754.1 cyclodeaminase/cyclohydrolase family protein [Proteiniphilum sp.]SCD20432.1 Formiminotransferase-cyclodeaminase [Proteiniphilum saccharofermentans]SEA45257.1 Formiminotetrahydrofolate cyclodeaminase [Porphyromonadaceae bacterium KH3R12]SFT06748.1 Formiminotetrahydrofolate cyclodeaminase [Porphyromonadaceae bacterium NLAE-zl-C104]
MKLQDLTLKEFLEKTAANEALPGGGSSSALNAAIASALTGMMANLTVGKKNYAGVEEQMKKIVEEMEENRLHFINDIDRDADAYSLVMDAYKLPKETDEQKKLRSEKIQEAMKVASLVPMEVAERAHKMLDTIIETIRKGNKNAVTDGMVGLMACRTAIMGALLNVRINLGGINDTVFVEELKEKCERIEKDTITRENEMTDWVKSII